MRATFDSNCLVALGLTQAASSDLRMLLRLHDRSQITVCVPGVHRPTVSLAPHRWSPLHQ